MNTIDIFPWNEHFNTGLKTVDNQHKKLVEILNNLASHIAYNTNEADLSVIFDELTEYTLYHFETEEAIWHKHLPNDPLDSDHQAIHQQFVDRVIKLKEEQSTRPLIELAEEALGFLARWLASHILETDRYMAYLIFALKNGLELEEAKEEATKKMSGSTRLLIDIILSIYGTLSMNTLSLMRELKTHQKLEEKVDDQDLYLDMLLELSTKFINLPLDEIDHNINMALERIANLVGADRAYVFDYENEAETSSIRYEWCAKDIAPQIDILHNIPLALIPQWHKPHQNGDYILIKDVNLLEEGFLRDLIMPMKIECLISFPIFIGSECTGFVGFSSSIVNHDFSSKEIAILELFSKLLSNLSQRKDNESKLSSERTFHKTLFQAIPDLVWAKDINGVYISCNARFESLLGIKEFDILGKTDDDLFDKDLANLHKMEDNNVIQTRNSYMGEEELIFKSDGHSEILHKTKIPMYDEEGIVSGIMGVSRNITSLKEIQKELEKKEHYQRALLDNFPFMIWLKDEKSQFLALNKSMANACGFSESKDLIGKTDYEVRPKELANLYMKDDVEVITSGKSKTIEEQTQTDSGKKWSETYKSPVTVDGEVIGTVGFARDITNKKELERNIIKERNLFEHYLNTVESIIVSLDSNGCISLINRKACELLGYKSEELIGKQWFELCLDQPEGMVEVYPVFLEIMKGELEGVEYMENNIITKSNEKRLVAWHNAYLLDDEGHVTGTLSSGEDITLLREQQRRLEHMAHYDTLTNLPNRILLSDRLHQAIIHAQRNKSFLAVIFLDLDGFKEVNDTYGHDSGDILLKTMSNRILATLRENDTISRLGGDEFAIVLHDLKDKKDSLPMLKRILSVVSRPVISQGNTMNVTASIGVSFFNKNDSIDGDQLLRQADQAMYQAKIEGKNRFHFFDVVEDSYLRKHNENIEDIETALKNNEFVMYYQPKVNMRSGKFLGLEALIRWNHPKQGILEPLEFLPTIEKHHLLLELGAWVIENVMQQITKWKNDGLHTIVSINICAMQLQETNFMHNILNLLELYPKVKASDFIFEILETSALEDMSHISYIMKECNDIGIDFSLDDFGTGYSSLSYLKGLPAKQLKIDQSFVRDMLDDTDDMAILEGIISLASAFRREVIAEGVESIEQGKMLLRLGCEEAQGYIIAKPMPPNEIVQWAQGWKGYPQWTNISAVSRDELQILYAMTEHKIWIKNVVNYLQNKSIVIPMLSHKQCRFGIWLYAQNTKDKIKTDAFNEIEKLHADIHKNITDIIKENKYETLSNKNIDSEIEKVYEYGNKFIEDCTRIFLMN